MNLAGVIIVTFALIIFHSLMILLAHIRVDKLEKELSNLTKRAE